VSGKSHRDYFKLNRSEIVQALHTLGSLSSNINEYNLAYSYGADLNEVPELPSDMDSYASVLIARARVEMEKPEADRDWLQIVKSLGMAGSLRKMIGFFEDAEKLLQYSLEKNCPRRILFNNRFDFATSTKGQVLTTGPSRAFPNLSHSALPTDRWFTTWMSCFSIWVKCSFRSESLR
jgi:hypothetical protein